MTLHADVRLTLGALQLDAALDVHDGETVAVLGPNGAGKTTLLRAIAGLVDVEHGSISIDGVVVDDPESGRFVPPERRSVGVVFQDYLLFPHMSARENVAFGLRARGMSRTAARRTADDWLDRVGLAARGAARPGRLSGGQQQRLALARALAGGPRVLLLDEPLAALDAATRAELRRELRTDLASGAGSRLLVTHELLDAVALADRVVILEDGHVVQAGTIGAVADRPRSRYVADLVGINLMRGIARGHEVALGGGGTLVTADAAAGDVYVALHPHAVALHRHVPEGSARNVFRGHVGGTDLLGDRVRVHVDGVVPLVAEVTPAAIGSLGLDRGVEVWASVKATELTVYPA